MVLNSQSHQAYLITGGRAADQRETQVRGGDAEIEVFEGA
jgi:hypothetical protein